MSFQKVSYIDVECKGALVYEGERKIGLSAFISLVLCKAQVRSLSHGVLTEPHDLSHFPDTGCNFQKLRLRGIHTILLSVSGNKKARPKDNKISLRRAFILFRRDTRGTTQIAFQRNTTQAPSSPLP